MSSINIIINKNCGCTCKLDYKDQIKFYTESRHLVRQHLDWMYL